MRKGKVIFIIVLLLIMLLGNLSETYGAVKIDDSVKVYTYIDYFKDNLIRAIKNYDLISISEYLEIMKYDTIFNEIYKGQYLVSSLYGERVLRNGDSRFHNGLDIESFGNKEIHSIIDGTVMSSLIIVDKSNPTWEWGNYVRIDDGYGYKIFYCHLGQRTVSKGDKVKKGDIIGIEGNTGYSLEPHLHLEIRKGNDVIHPYEYFRIIEGRN